MRMTGAAEIKRTAGAQRALGLAQLVNKVFATERVRSTKPGHAGYCVEMTAPDAPSTADAKRALQFLKLVPVESTGGSSIIFATADSALSHAEIRSFEHLTALHAQRYGGEHLPIERREYDALLEKVRQFFRGQDIETKITLPSDDERRAVSIVPPAVRANKLVAVLVGVAVLLLIALVASAFRSR